MVNSGQTYLLGMTVVILFHRYIMQDASIKPSRILTVLFIVAVIALQHRSVWVASLIGVVSLFLLPGIKKHKIISKLAVIGALGAIFMLPLLSMGYLDHFIDSIVGSAEKATNLNTGTFGARRKGWEQIMEYWVKQDFLHQLLGDPFGGGYANLKSSPHNFFLQSLLRTGILGNLFICLFYFSILLKLYLSLLLSDSESRFYPVLFFILIVAQLAFYIPYAPQAEHGIILGIAASLTKRKMKSEKEVVFPNNQYFLSTSKNNSFKSIIPPTINN
ncbi:MAG: O-antigen ligase family protein [Methylococcales bacterium]|nr:O-antigen ligase family protein [Methylococcales bacterium]